VKLRQDHRGSGDTLVFVHIYGYPPAVIVHHDAVVGPDAHIDGVAEAGSRLVNAVVHDLIDEMMETFFTRTADVHGRPLSDGIETF